MGHKKEQSRQKNTKKATEISDKRWIKRQIKGDEKIKFQNGQKMWQKGCKKAKNCLKKTTNK